MKSRLRKKRIAVLSVVLAAALSFAGCGNEKTETQSYEYFCTLSIDCSSVWEHENDLSDDLKEILPTDGCILKTTEIGFHEGETAFDVAVRVCREKKVPVEYSTTPLTGSSYIEGINQLYEFDCGELSGWKYAINGEWPGIASTDCVLHDGDEVLWYFAFDGVTEFVNP